MDMKLARLNYRNVFQSERLRPACGRLLPAMLILPLLCWLPSLTLLAQESRPFPSNLSQMDPDRAGQLLAAFLRSTVPEEASHLKGNLKIQQRRSATLNLPFQFEVCPGQGKWETIYATAGQGEIPAQKLTIVRQNNAPNQYFMEKAARPGAPLGAKVLLTNSEANIRFAGSDFWLTDLGLEFAYWPGQGFLKGEMREGRYCYILQSTKSKPTNSGYSRVLSWVDQESGGIVLAEAYDSAGKLLKEFAIRSLKKVQGHYQLKEMEMRNVQERSRTRLEFQYEEK